ncbi:hypothetical protein ILUMI_05027 [Ignelater luminosus]|uniref:Peptidase S1 domain-containing protein n=1 Tax=Ignelater luminosus TaxID=2038154 RepID=A0A8K0DBR4_IGNLU|nr:hypothetical protein ILUMI_05027 [Ignelater luminosus]
MGVMRLACLLALLHCGYSKPDKVKEEVLKAKRDQFPFFARLEMQLKWPHSDNKTYCGASLITWKSILTAAHCFYHNADDDKIKKLCKANKLRVYMGKSTHSTKTQNAETRYLENIVPHKKYKYDRSYDIAVGNLSVPFKSGSPLIKTITLPRYINRNRHSRVCSKAIIVGIGKASSNTKNGSVSVIYARVITRLKRHTPTLRIPDVPEFKMRQFKESNAGGSLICYQPENTPIQYGVIKSGEAVLVERVVNFIESWVGDGIQKPKMRMYKTDDDKIKRTSRSSSFAKVTYRFYFFLLGLNLHFAIKLTEVVN